MQRNSLNSKNKNGCEPLVWGKDNFPGQENPLSFLIAYLQARSPLQNLFYRSIKTSMPWMNILGETNWNVMYRRTSLSVVFLSADSLIHKCKISKGQIYSQNVSCHHSGFEVQNCGTYLPKITRLNCTSIFDSTGHRYFFERINCIYRRTGKIFASHE